MERYYVTTPIYYVNGPPHLGHTYTTIVADTLTRFAKLEGRDAYFLTGTDEHGTKNYQTARERGVDPQAWVDEISALFRNLWPTLNIDNDDFIRTTEERHKTVVQQILQTVYDKGEIYFGTYEGLYCTGCERFFDEDELVDGKCPDHGVAPEFIQQKNYFFRMSAYQDWLIQYLDEHPDAVRPERYMNEVKAFLKRPLMDLSISRPRDVLPWGIPLPWDEDHVTYVWFDALINYVSAIGGPGAELYERYWPAVEHITAKDILKTHAIYWPCMLKAADIPMFRHLNVHGFWRGGDGRKMSKSLGNTVDPIEMRDRYGADVFRYAMLREMPYGLDANISELIIAERNNSDLANDLGNLASRAIKLSQRSFGDTVTEYGALEPIDEELRDQWTSVLPKVREAWHELRMSQALEAVMECVRATNRYMEATEPWKLAKDESQSARLATVLYQALESLRVASALLWPVMPERMTELRRQLGIGGSPTLAECEQWGVLEPGTPLSPGDGLFPRADLDAVREREQAKVAEAQAQTEEAADSVAEEPAFDTISYDEFSRIKLKVAKVLTAEPVAKTDKLLRLTVDTGEGAPRQLVAGIAKSYAPEEIVGKRVVIVANLEPATIRGVESQGMILAAYTDDGFAVLTPDGDAEPGAEVR